jgi:predicted Zn-ribbon and HTH transcriptional regulator
MSTPKEQYDAMLDELPAEEQMRLIDHVPFARVLEDVDPVAYRCGLNDMQAACDDCGHEFWPDDHDAEALCEECRAKLDEDAEDPPCAVSTGCICAAHAKGRAVEGPCDAREDVEPDEW